LERQKGEKWGNLGRETKGKKKGGIEPPESIITITEYSD